MLAPGNVGWESILACIMMGHSQSNADIYMDLGFWMKEDGRNRQCAHKGRVPLIHVRYAPFFCVYCVPYNWSQVHKYYGLCRNV